MEKSLNVGASINITKFLIAVLLAVSFSLIGSQHAHAKSTSWTSQILGTFYQYLQISYPDSEYYGFWYPEKSLEWPTITVQYHAQVKNSDTGVIISDGAVLPIGTQLTFEAIPFEDTDISWVAGFTYDTPFGHWIPNAEPPPFSCALGPYGDYVPPTGDFGTYATPYAPLSVNPPNVAIDLSGSTANLSCDASQINCTITSAGTINATISFAPTFGKYYGRYRYFGELSPYDIPVEYTDTDGKEWGYCFGNQYPASFIPLWINTNILQYFLSSVENVPLPYPTYTLTVPQQTIPFSFTASGTANNPPTTPTIVGPTTGVIDTFYSFNITSTDPDGNTIRYGIDWDFNSTVDQWVPATGHVTSGVTQTGTKQWTTTGSKSFKALAQDNQGVTSGWATHTITLTDPSPPVGAVCGDGTVESPEVCDDDNTQNEDYCSSDCLTAYSCGDGIIQSSLETCDLGPPASKNGSCPKLCSATCSTQTCGGGSPCEDNFDNDGDRLTDKLDPGCWKDNYNLFTCLTYPNDSSCYDPSITNENNCGNLRCEPITGENPITCPADCKIIDIGER